MNKAIGLPLSLSLNWINGLGMRTIYLLYSLSTFM
jgi:hypothetical protein